MMPLIHRSDLMGCEGGRDVSPHLRWSFAPHHTKSYVVTMYTPDAPTGSGMWHWTVANIPDSVTSLPQDAGNGRGDLLPRNAIELPNDLGMSCYVGGAGAAGASYRYFLTVHALDVRQVKLQPNSTPARLGWLMSSHVIARATMITKVGDVGYVPGIGGDRLQQVMPK